MGFKLFPISMIESVIWYGRTTPQYIMVFTNKTPNNDICLKTKTRNCKLKSILATNTIAVRTTKHPNHQNEVKHNNANELRNMLLLACLKFFGILKFYLSKL